MVPFRMANRGVEWLDAVAQQHRLTRSDVIRMALQYAKEHDADARFSAYLDRAVRQGRITRQVDGE